MPAANSLAEFLEHPSRPPETLRYQELQGFLFAVTTAPELIRPSEWVPEVFGGAEAGFETLEEAQAIMPELMALYNAVNASVRSARPSLPRDCRFRRDLMANFADDAPISRWSRGFLHGYQWLEASWDECVPEEHDRDFGLMLMTLTFFARETLAAEYVKEIGRTDLKEAARVFRSAFPGALADFARIARLVQDVLLRHDAPAEPNRSQPKVGRNDPCTCGSGRKYKKCCGANPAH